MSIKAKIKELGQSVGFSLAYYNNPTDHANTTKARQATNAFLEGFANYLEENELEMTAGFDDFEAIGQASYLAVKPVNEDVLLMMVLVPHDVIDVEKENEDE